MSTDRERAITSARRKRGAAKASLKRLDGRVADLEARGELTIDDRLSSQQMLQKLNSVEADFKAHHLTLVDLLDEEAQEGEQIILDETDDKIACLTVRLQRLVSRSSSMATPSPFIESTLKRRLSRRLDHLEKELRAIGRAIESMSSGEEVDTCLLSQHQEQLGDLNSELANVLQELLSADGDDTTLSERHAQLSQILFDARLQIVVHVC